MLLEFVVASVILASSYAVYKIHSMSVAERYSLLLEFILKSRIGYILGKLNIRPEEVEVIASNGVKTLLPHPIFRHTVDLVLKLDMRHDDVIIATYPKAGTTWMQEIVWLICNDADIAAANRKSLLLRTAFVEIMDSNTTIGNGIIATMKWPKDDRRVLKTHLRYEMLPEGFRCEGKGKVIYVARNPKDVCVSYFHFHRMHEGLPNPGNWDHFLSKFCSGRIGWGSWFDHNLTYWKKFQEHQDHIYFVTFEELIKNLRSELEPIAKFLGKNLSPDQLDAIAEHCTFDKMSKNEATNYYKVQKYGFNFKVSKFMRKGKVGDWKNHFTLNQNEDFDFIYREKMKGSGLDFVFELDVH